MKTIQLAITLTFKIPHLKVEDNWVGSLKIKKMTGGSLVSSITSTPILIRANHKQISMPLYAL